MKRVLAFILLLLPAVSHGQIVTSDPVTITSNTAANSPCLHVGRDGSVNISWFCGDTSVFFSRSTDAGLSFSSPVIVNHIAKPNDFATSLQRVPNFVIDTKGVIHMIWNLTRPTYHADLVYTRSTDNGATWSKPVSILDADDSASYPLNYYSTDFPSIACDSSNNLYVSYLDNRFLERGLTEHYVMHVERSTDGGKTWSLPVIANKLPVANAGTCECCTEEIASSPEGHLYIAFRTDMDVSSKLDDRSIFISRSMDGGITWDSAIRCQLGTWNLPACPTKGPHIALDPNENLLLAWNDQRDDTGKLVAYYATLKHGASSVTSNYSISNSASQRGHWPAIALSPKGTIAYAFMPSDGGGSLVQFTYSSDGGNTWNRRLQYPMNSIQDQALPSISFAPDGKLYTAWQEGSGATTRGIASALIQGWQTSGVRTAPISQDLKVYPNPAERSIRVVLPQNLSGACQVTIADVAGNTLLHSNSSIDDGSLTIDIHSLQPGQYFCTIAKHDERWITSFVAD